MSLVQTVNLILLPAVTNPQSPVVSDTNSSAVRSFYRAWVFPIIMAWPWNLTRFSVEPSWTELFTRLSKSQNRHLEEYIISTEYAIQIRIHTNTIDSNRVPSTTMALLILDETELSIFFPPFSSCLLSDFGRILIRYRPVEIITWLLRHIAIIPACHPVCLCLWACSPSNFQLHLTAKHVYPKRTALANRSSCARRIEISFEEIRWPRPAQWCLIDQN